MVGRQLSRLLDPVIPVEPGGPGRTEQIAEKHAQGVRGLTELPVDQRAFAVYCIEETLDVP